MCSTSQKIVFLIAIYDNDCFNLHSPDNGLKFKVYLKRCGGGCDGHFPLNFYIVKKSFHIIKYRSFRKIEL